MTIIAPREFESADVAGESWARTNGA